MSPQGPEVLTAPLGPPPALPPPALPWEDADCPRLAALLSTVWKFWRHPGQGFRTMSREGWEEPLGFGLITGTFGLLAASYSQLLFSLSLGEFLTLTPEAGGFALGGARGIVALMFLVPPLVLVGLLLGSLCLLVVLRLWRRPATFPAALRVGCYAQAGLVLAMVPLLGAFGGVSWSLYLRVRGVQEVFELPGWRAWIAVLLALLLETLVLLMALLTLAVLLLVSRLF